MRKRIILGISIIILFSLAGTGSAKIAYSAAGADCNYCHVSVVDGEYLLTNHGSYFRDVHKFNGITVPSNANSCLTCHTDLIEFLPLTSVGSKYNITHRYNSDTLASQMLPVPGCGNCHVNAISNNFNLLTGTPTYLTSSICQDCHKAKYDIWSNTLHRVMLTPKDKAQAMNLPTPPVGWDSISYVVVTKFAFAYINTTGYFPSQDDIYNTTAQEFENGYAGAAYGTCGKCHTTGWNASARNSSLPGISGTFSEPGIACERCHGSAGNGHQVVINYSGFLCTECHTGGNHGTGWENGEHAPPPFENGTNCMFCHSSFDQYKNQGATIANATGVSCGVCHNIHDMTDSKYAATFSQGTFDATTWSKVVDSKLAFFNATASIAAGTDIFDNLSSITSLYPGIDSIRKDSSYGTAPINLTGRPISEVLCSICHYRHGLAHTAGVNLTHGQPKRPATCVDCHMGGSNRTVGKDMMNNHAMDPLYDSSCNGCHPSNPALIKEWKASAHNDKEVGVPNANTGIRNPNSSFYRSINGTTGKVTINSRPNSCLKCHSPINWNPAISESDTASVQLAAGFKGITCSVCHNIHDMGDWLAMTKAMFGVSKPYAWYNKTAILTGTRYKANYTVTGSTIELCGNCHSNIRYGNTGPGWVSGAVNPISPHGYPAKDLFVGSFKDSYMKFECIDCHVYSKTTDATGALLNDNEIITGHSFAVNATGLQKKDTCNIGCHDPAYFDSIPAKIQDIKTKTHNKWNTTNATVMSALNNVKAYAGEKNESRTLIAQAYWNLELVSSDNSWGVHNQIKVNQLLDDAVTLANSANAALVNNTLASAITPNSRNAQLGKPVTLFMSVINGGTATASGVSISQASSLPVTLSYQQWDGTSFIGAANTPVDIAAGATANFVLTIEAISVFGTSSMTFNVSGTNVAAPISLVNTLTISASATPSADVIMVSTTLNLSTPVNNATTFAIATTNVGGASATDVSLLVNVPSTITGLAIQVNHTNSTTGAIMGPATGLTIDVGAQPAFAVFLIPTEAIAFDPTNNRITLQLVDGSGKIIGAQSVAVSTT